MLNAVVKSSAPGGIVDLVKTDGEYSIRTLAQFIINHFLYVLSLLLNQLFKLDLLFAIKLFNPQPIKTHFTWSHQFVHQTL
jgi:hypothetical protein